MKDEKDSKSPRESREDSKSRGERGKGPGRGRPDFQRGGRKIRRKSCRFCADKIVAIDHKRLDQIRSFLTERGKILPRRVSGNCAGHQRALTTAIKRARALALLPYTTG